MVLGTITTDWISAIGTLIGIPVAGWGIFKLFIKDKDQVQKLKFIEEQVEEFRKQTSQFELQTQLMIESNQLLEKQLQFQSEVYLQTKSKEAVQEELEKQKRKNDIKPRFMFYGANGSGANFTVKLINKGGNAENIKINSVNTDFVSMVPLKENLNIDSEHILSLSGIANPSKTYFNSNQVPCEILISFMNIDGDRYLQKITKSYNGYQVGNPYEDNS